MTKYTDQIRYTSQDFSFGEIIQLTSDMWVTDLFKSKHDTTRSNCKNFRSK